MTLCLEILHVASFLAGPKVPESIQEAINILAYRNTYGNIGILNYKMYQIFRNDLFGFCTGFLSCFFLTEKERVTRFNTKDDHQHNITSRLKTTLFLFTILIGEDDKSRMYLKMGQVLFIIILKTILLFSLRSRRGKGEGGEGNERKCLEI